MILLPRSDAIKSELVTYSVWLSCRNFFREGGTIYCFANFYFYANLYFVFRPNFLGGGNQNLLRRTTASGGKAPASPLPPPVEESQQYNCYIQLLTDTETQKSASRVGSCESPILGPDVISKGVPAN